MKSYKDLRLNCKISTGKKDAALIRKRCVGSFHGELVYFIPAPSKYFYLVIESSPGHFRKLTDKEHRSFKEQSHVENAGWEERTP